MFQIEPVEKTNGQRRLGRAPLPTLVGVYLAGVLMVGVGVAAMVRARLGVSPNDVLNTGLADTLGVGVGTGVWITSAVAMGLAWILGRMPRLPTIFGGVIVGSGVNIAVSIIPHVDHVAVRLALLAAGLVAVWAGIVAVVAADLGAGPMELIMLALVDRGIGIRTVRWGIELTLLAIGLALGGDASLGTAVFALATGPVLAWALPPACRWLGTTLSVPTELAANGP